MSLRRTGFAPAPRRLPELRQGWRDDWRLILVMAGFIAAYAVVGLRMGLSALGDPSEPAREQVQSVEATVRGQITDRAGRLLAANLPAWALYADPREIRDPVAAADALAPIFPEVGRDRLLRTLASERRFVWVARPVTPRQKAEVMDLAPAIPALEFGRREMRVYPAGRLAAHVMGGVRAEAEGVNAATLVGQAGVEQHFDPRLRDPALVDTPLALSLDLGVQAALTEVLAAGVRRTGAIGGAAILIDVRTGELIAMVSLPDFDPNAPVRTVAGGDANPLFNRPVKGIYELGSVFKPITAAIALDAGLVTPETMVETGSPIFYGRQRIRDMHRMPAAMSVTDVIRRSSNIGAARLAMRVGTPRFRAYLERFGLLAPIPLELPEAGAARPMLPPRWSDLSTMTISFGHGLAISPLHLAAAYATVANGGRRVIPTLAKGGRPPGEQVISERAAADTLAMLRTVVERGTGRRTDLPGYFVGGKTGTADKAKPNGGYYKDRVIASFAAVFPTTDPAYTLLVMLDEPTDPETGRREASRTAVPVTAAAIRRIAPMLGLRPEPAPFVAGGPVPAGLLAREAAR